LKIELQKWKALNVRALAEMTSEVRRKEGLGDYTVDQVEEYLKRMNERFPIEIAVVALENGQLIGWMGLERMTDEIGEVGRWHPFVSQDPLREDVASQMISEVNRYALENGIRRMEIGFGEISENNRNAFSNRQSWYEAADWNRLEEDLFMAVNPMDRSDTHPPNLDVEFDLRPLVDVDVEKLFDCYHQSFMTGEAVWIYEMTEEQRRQEFDKNFDKSKPINKEASFVLEKDGEVAAFILVLSRTEEEEYIESFGVHPTHRGRGLAKFLLWKVIEVLRMKGAENLTLGVDSVNIPAVKLYEQYGFRSVSRTVRYSWKADV
jgi:ribosomal protein S18 acetylase RimI-like enzyme